MGTKFFKSSKSNKKNITKSNNIKEIVVTCKVIHVGEVLKTDFILKNRSSKYQFLSF